jgi:DNA-binding response OmpR family regulator
MRRAERIVVVEDDPLFRKALKRRLECDGWRVEACGTLAEALRALDTGGVAAVVTDIGLPDGSGLELALRVRGAPGSPPLIALSADLDGERGRAARLGVAILDKCDIATLLGRLDRLCARPMSRAG